MFLLDIIMLLILNIHLTKISAAQNDVPLSHDIYFLVLNFLVVVFAATIIAHLDYFNGLVQNS